MKFEAVNVIRVRGNPTYITSEEPITGQLEFVPRQGGGAILMLPVAVLIAANEENRKRGIMEIPPLSRMDLYLRTVLTLSKSEVARVVKLLPNEELELSRKGWGCEWKNRIRRVMEDKREK